MLKGSQAAAYYDNLKKIKIAIPIFVKNQTELAKSLFKTIINFHQINEKISRQLEAIEALPAAILREVFEFKS